MGRDALVSARREKPRASRPMGRSYGGTAGRKESRPVGRFTKKRIATRGSLYKEKHRDPWVAPTQPGEGKASGARQFHHHAFAVEAGHA